jgi:hydroxyethylthiazole kinase
MTEEIFRDIEIIRQTRPVIHHLTNLVVMQTNANVLLALGAAPLMAHAHEELAEISIFSQALVLNMGTLDKQWIESAKTAQRHAIEKNKPVIFDPAGAGASRYRTETAKAILADGATVLRANASEILALMNLERGDNTEKKDICTKGVESSHHSLDAVDTAAALSEKYNCIVVISGKTDVIVNKDRKEYIHYGSELFTRLTGMGCSETSFIAAFCAVNPDYYSAVIHAVTVFTLAGERAGRKSEGPGSFSSNLLDILYTLRVSV